MFAREADEAHAIGPAAARPYLDLAVLERALTESQADAAWVGWGFVAEDPAFADLCERIGVTFIGPSAEAMRKLGDKIGSKLIAEEVGVPVAAWSRGGVDTLDEALAAADRIGYPLMLKATAGGGGRGIRLVDTGADLEDAYQRTRDEAERAFGSGVVFLERLVTGARHVEVQVIADAHGTAWAVGVRDCTVQRRNQKVIEESASPLLDDDQTAELKAAAERLAVAVDYVGAGTVEFLYHPGERTFAFLEVNTRLQVEHPITEMTTDLDLVKAQIHVAAGGRLEGAKPLEKGHAVEARLNAEDPDRDFAPSPGRIALLELPVGPGHPRGHRRQRGRHDPRRLRLDDREGHRVRRHPRRGAGPAPSGDGRDHRRDRGRRHQQELHPRPARPVRGRGRRGVPRPAGRTPAGSTGRAPRAGWSSSGTPASPSWPPASRPTRTRPGSRSPGSSRARTADGPRCSTRSAVRSTSSSATRRTASPCCRPVRTTSASRSRPGRPSSVVDADDRADRRVPHPAHRRGRLLPARHRHPRSGPPRRGRRRHPPGEPATRAACCARPRRRSSSPPRSRVGDVVEAGAPVLVLESMKMETVAPRTVRRPVRELARHDRRPGRHRRAAGAARAGRRTTRRGRRRRRPRRPGARPAGGRLPATAQDRAARAREELPPVLMGFDLDPTRRETAVLDALPRRRARSCARGRRPRRVGAGAAPLGSPTSPSSAATGRSGEELHTELRVHSAREHFHTYLQSLDVERGGLPAGVPRPAGPGARALRRHRVGPHAPSSRRRSSGSSSPSSAPARTCSSSTALLQQLDGRAAAVRGARRTPREAARAPRPRHPAPLPGGR